MSQSQHHPYSLCVPLEYSLVCSLCTNTVLHNYCSTEQLRLFKWGRFCRTKQCGDYQNSGCYHSQKQNVKFCNGGEKKSGPYFSYINPRRVQPRRLLWDSTRDLCAVAQFSNSPGEQKEKGKLLESPISSASQVLSDKFYPILLH